MIRYVGSAVAQGSLPLGSESRAGDLGGRPIGQRHDPRHGHGFDRRRGRRRQGHHRQRRHRPHPRPSPRTVNGEYTAPSLPTGRYTVMSEMTGLQDRRALERRGRRRPARAHRHQARGRRDDRVGQRHRRDAAAADLVVRAGHDGRQRADRGAAAQRPQLRQPDPHVPGVLRGIPGANIDGAGSLAWRASASFSANGQRPRDNNYMLDGVDNNETWLQTVVHLPERRRARRVQAADQHLLGRVRPVARRRRQPADQVGHQQAARQRLRVPPQRRVRRQQLLQQPRRTRPSPSSSRTSSAAPSAARCSRTRRSSSPTTRATARRRARRSSRPCRRWRMRGGRLLRAEPRHLRSDAPASRSRATSFRAAASTTVARNILTQLYPEPNTAGTRQANGQTINNYLINPIKERQDNQFDVKVDHNLTTSNRFFTRYSYQKTHRLQPATLPHGDAGATFGAGDGNIKAPEPGVQRHPHASARTG